MAPEQRFPMGLHLPGLLQILGEHLYSDPRVALREAVQNAHDSCRRRAAEEGDPDYRPWVRVLALAETECIEIHDNGSGLDESEVHEFLATIGRSYTGELRGQLELCDRDAAEALIGQFGLGLLSSFLLAKRVTLHTRSYREGSKSLCWSSTGGQTYELTPHADREVGSCLRLELKPAARFLLEEKQIEEALRQFVDLLEVPVHVGDSAQPLNRGQAPWHQDSDETAYREFIRERFGIVPLSVLPLKDHVVEWGRGSRITVPLRGVLFIPPGSVTSLQEYGDVSVYVRRMFICERERDLLPAWARFVRGVVESPRLRPTVSRESLRQDEFFQQVRRGLGEQLVQHLTELATSQPEVWREVVLGHNDLIKGWAVQEPTLFAAVADLMHFTTSRGRLSLPEILAVTNDTLYFYADETGSNQEKMLYEASDLLVIDASHFAEEAFLRRYAAQRPGVRLEQLQPGTSTFFRAAPETALPVVRAHFESRGIACRCVEFQPSSLPALMVFPPAHDQIQRVREVVDSGAIHGPLAELMGDFLARRGASGSGGVPLLHLNAGSPLLAELEELGKDSFLLAPALELIHQAARFFAGKNMPPDEARESFESAMRSLGTLVALGRESGRA